MLNWFQALLPKEDNFFRLFDAHALSLVHGAGALRKMMDGGPETGEWCAKVVAHEEEADEVAREVLFAVRRSFITPFDRADIRGLTGFTPVAEYGNRKPIHEQELGSVENFRFITSPELASYANAGDAVGTTGLYSTGASNIDVYPMIVCGEDAWGQVTLRGADALDPTWIPPGEKTKSDPLGQRGFVGAKFYMQATVLNQGWMAVLEVGVTAL